jgi:hypothetical protein
MVVRSCVLVRHECARPFGSGRGAQAARLGMLPPGRANKLRVG